MENIVTFFIGILVGYLLHIFISAAELLSAWRIIRDERIKLRKTRPGRYNISFEYSETTGYTTITAKSE
jgi:hypothetical protein